MMAIGCGVRVSPLHGVPLGSAVPFMVVVEDGTKNERQEKVEGEKKEEKGVEMKYITIE